MIELAKLVDPPSRRVRQIYEQQVDEPQREAYGKIANARFALYGSSVYPDATFTLRLAFGEVKGYTEDGQTIPWATTLGGTFEHAAAHDNKEPFQLPAIWNQRKGQLNLSTPFNFVSTADIIGGNSGSPVVEPRRRVGWNYFRWQHPVSRTRLHLHRSTGARRGGAFGRHFGSAAKGLLGGPPGSGNHRRKINSEVASARAESC